MNEEMNLMSVTSNPHIRDNWTTQKIMMHVIIALMPATLFGVWHFGAYTIAVILVTVISAIFFEFMYEKLLKLPITIGDCSAALTGLLLALNMPPRIPLWICVIGAFVAIVLVKQLFGGLGQNFMNPALGARCFLVISFASYMTNFAYDTYSGATPLAQLKAGELVNTFHMVVGNEMGTIGEVSVLAIVIGACYLILLGIIDLTIPGTYIVTFVIFWCIFGGKGIDPYYITGQLAGGGLMLGAFFMATDYVSSPITFKGRVIFGILLGILTGVFRVFASGAEGVSYAIIISNLFVPLIERWAPLKCFGYVKPEKGGDKK
ncbi:MAG: RnfABCDGE type electron transport complex subunit D [Lachnospiraceae bacterium]|nr:RnfABCDGE type electron transport complex subunit D [Lachnospiraceae bacterium]MCR5023406.1 RnfABCDGE type electron transport complex subunit D [Lachnospiraceae bacterium]